jgi:hypothetical protein
MNANATERESDFTTVLELSSQVRDEAKRQRNLAMAKVKVGFPLTVRQQDRPDLSNSNFRTMLQWPAGSEEKEVILVFSHIF